MESVEKQSVRRCYGCGRPLAEGVRFCVACGKHNFDPDAANLASAMREIKVQKTRTFVECFTHWWRYFLAGIRR